MFFFENPNQYNDLNSFWPDLASYRSTLKEIEQRESTRLDDEALLSEPIKQLIAQMARLLKTEAAEFADSKLQVYQEGKTELRQHLAEAQHQTETLKATNETLTKELSTAQEQHSKLIVEQQVQAQRIQDLEQALSEKDKHIESLEVKHTHARESLEHYRTSVKEQREHDRRRHEKQILQYQAEQRQLQQSLVVKQDELTQATSEQTRLFTELRETRKHLEQLDSTYIQEQRESRKLAEAQAASRNEIDFLEQQLATAQSQLTQQETEKLQIRDLEAELRVKDQLLNSLEKAIKKSTNEGLPSS